MKPERRCKGCGSVIAADAPFGHCPKCLLQHAADSIREEASQSPGESDTTSPTDSAELGPNSHIESVSEADGTGVKPGDRIGRYKLLEKIGEGGCGIVYMAEQEEPVRRRVALKIIKLGMDTREVIARFEAERQALALMEHTHIAKIFDGGATDTGRPYFVMELVRGLRARAS